METFITSKVFNPNLNGKAVWVTGHDTEGEEYDRVFLVKDVAGEYITLINCQGKLIEGLHIENFTYGDAALKIVCLEEPKND